MLEFLQTGKALSVLAAIGVIGIVSKLITRSLYKRLLKETDNMAMTKNKNLKALKQKLENAYRLNQNIVNTQAYLEKQLYGFRFMHLSLDSWNNLSMQMVILGLLAGGAGSFLAYWYRLDSYYIVLYASIGALSGLLLTFMDSSFNIVQKQQRLETILLEYVDNSVFVRAARENAGRDAASTARATLTVQDRDRDRLPREEGLKDRLSRDGERKDRLSREESLKDRLSREEELKDRLSREEELKDRFSREKELEDRLSREEDLKDRLSREEDVKNGLVQEEEPRRGSIRSIKGRNSKAEELLRAVRTIKDEEEQEKNGKRQGSNHSGVSVSSAGRNKGAARDRGFEDSEADSPARRDIDYLKKSLEQIAASKDKPQEEPASRERDWMKNLNNEEIKLIGEIMKQYFSGA